MDSMGSKYRFTIIDFVDGWNLFTAAMLSFLDPAGQTHTLIEVFTHELELSFIHPHVQLLEIFLISLLFDMVHNIRKVGFLRQDILHVLDLLFNIHHIDSNLFDVFGILSNIFINNS